MVPDRDYYADKNGRLTDDPNEYARQIAVKGCFLDERVARKFGISDILVPVDEPAAPRRVTSANQASVKITKAEEKEKATTKPQEPAGAKAKKPAAKKEKK